MKLKEILEIKGALDYIASKELYGAKLNYMVAKNLKRINPIIADFDEENKIRIKSFAQKDEKGEPLVIDKQYQFGDNLEIATEEYKKLLEKDHEITFHKYKLEEDKIPGAILLPLLDIIIEE